MLGAKGDSVPERVLAILTEVGVHFLPLLDLISLFDFWSTFFVVSIGLRSYDSVSTRADTWRLRASYGKALKRMHVNVIIMMFPFLPPF